MSGLASYLRRMWRAALQPDSYLSVEEAVEALPVPGPAAEIWLRDRVQPAGQVAGVVVYRWGDIVAQLTQDQPASSSPALPKKEAETWLTTDEVATRLGIARDTLDEMVARAPRSLPGAPVNVGGGKKRRHLRWDPARLEEWMVAYQAWHASRGKRRTAPSPVSMPRAVHAPSWPAVPPTAPQVAAPPQPTTKRRQSVLAMVKESEG